MPTCLLLTVWFLLCIPGSLHMVAAQNKIGATTHPDDGFSLSSMNDLDVTGQIPEFIGNWTKLTILKIQGTGWRGPIPSSFSNLTSLTELVLGDISNGGSSLEIIKDMKSLKVLRNNNLTGTIPSNFGEYSNLLELSMNDLDVTGQIPELIGNWTKLTILVLGDISKGGSSLEIIKDMKSLSILVLRNNNLTGTIPSNFGEYSNLLELFHHSLNLMCPRAIRVCLPVI
ncbi:hypothetical protein DY000_02013259 [Brassica cretica]|uniref:Leucine-rich repeat-containing N-terminal plant-type domain-containing protein n=1 Tax=Brassica cretica TaxID=69181 RepID=A0ABQ7D289_BRACR|nr:hypothetical protein DY000_02013259 [Brassica cretica]